MIRNCKGPLTEAWPVYTALSKKLSQKKKNLFQIEIIHIGIQKRVVTPLKKEKPTPLTIGWLGRLSPEKDPFLYIELADQFSESSLVFKMAGDGPLRDKVETRISKMKNVKFEGFVENSEDFLKGLDILILTSEIEGIPLVAMEALQLGVFVVAPEIGGLSDLIRNDKDGLLYKRTKMHAAESIRKAVDLVSQGSVSPSLDSNFEEKSMFDRIESRIEYHAKKSNL
jgi:glycosyltransferase involved in cell wall biosynthesis